MNSYHSLSSMNNMTLMGSAGFQIDRLSSSKVNAIVKNLYSKSQDEVKNSLNVLLVKSADAEVDVLLLERYPDILVALCDLLEVVNPLGNMIEFITICNFDAYMSADNSHTSIFLKDIVSYDPKKLKLVAAVLDSNAILLTVLAVIRNLSFEAINQSSIAFSVVLVKHLTAILISNVECLSENSYSALPDACQLAFEILSNVGHKIDMNGRRRKETLLNEESISLNYFDQAALRNGISSSQSHSHKRKREAVENFPLNSCVTFQQFQQNYVDCVACLVPFIYEVLKDSYSSRDLVSRSLDLLVRLAHSSENITYFTNCCVSDRLSAPVDSKSFCFCPADFAQLLVDYICYNSTSMNPSLIHSSLSTIPPSVCVSAASSHVVPAAVVSAPTSFIAEGGGGGTQVARLGSCSASAHDFFDVEVCDAALDCLHVLCTKVDAFKVCVGQTKNCVATLLRRISGVRYSKLYPFPTAGANAAAKSSGAQKAGSLMNVLSSHPLNADICLAHHTEILVAASCDDIVADTVYGNAPPQLYSTTLVVGTSLSKNQPIANMENM